MRLTIITLTFLFFGSVFATPINFERRDNAAVMKRSPQGVNHTGTSAVENGSENSGSSLSNSASTPGGTIQVVQKRKPAQTGWDATFSFINTITNKEVYDALKTIQTQAHIGKGQGGIVYKLGHTFSGFPAVVKVIYWPKSPGSEGEVMAEANNLYQVGQLYGVGHTHDRLHYYLVMPYLGAPFEEAEKHGLAKDHAIQLMNDAYNMIKKDCHLMHDDLSLDQVVFSHDGKQWIAVLIDWESAEVVKGWEGKLRKNPRKAFAMPPTSTVFVPPLEAFE